MQAIKQIRVNILHSDPVIAGGLASALRQHADIDVDDFRGCTESAFASSPCSAHAVHVVVADHEAGVAFAARCGERHSHAGGPRTDAGAPAVLVIAARRTGWEIRHALEVGVRGYLLLGCPVDELVDAVRSLKLGLRHLGTEPARLLADSVAREALTPREDEVLRLLVEGHGNKAIANTLDIAVGTVKSHMKSIFGKLDAATRTAAVTLAARRGLLLGVPLSATH
jgi:two-component system response regulator DesR